MRCPECHVVVETTAGSCQTCGLLLFKTAKALEMNLVQPIPASAPTRRAEDRASWKRRANDQLVPCQFCNGEIPKTAIRCKHCSEIVNEEFYRQRAARTRTRINYASWVAYLFGLGLLLVFRPAGLISIAAGLLLSIAYYAIPVEAPASPRNKRKANIAQFFKNQLRMERVAIPIPGTRNRKLIFVGTPLVAALIGYTANVILLQQPVNDVLKENAAFHGMEVSAHYQYWVVPGVVVYDLKSLDVQQTPIDVHTAFLEFAKKLREKKYTRVELSYRGATKFSMSGAAFTRLGNEYARHNYKFVLYEFAKLFQSESAEKKPLEEGASERDALLQFHRQWWGEDAMTGSVKNAM
jgi:hypothetical protein